MSREDGIHVPKAAVDIQRLVWFTTDSGSEEGAEAALCGHGTKLFFFLGTEICKRRLGNGHLSP
jgi:hypothetical protein